MQWRQLHTLTNYEEKCHYSRHSLNKGRKLRTWHIWRKNLDIFCREAMISQARLLRSGKRITMLHGKISFTWTRHWYNIALTAENDGETSAVLNSVKHAQLTSTSVPLKTLGTAQWDLWKRSQYYMALSILSTNPTAIQSANGMIKWRIKAYDDTCNIENLSILTTSHTISQAKSKTTERRAYVNLSSWWGSQIPLFMIC